MSTAYLNGHWIDLKHAHVSLLDQGMLRGDGLFETMRARGGGVPFLDDHYERISTSAQFAEIPVPIALPALHSIVRELLKRNNLSEAKLRLVFTRGTGNSMDPVGESISPTYFILAEALPASLKTLDYDKGVAIETTPVVISDRMFPKSLKTTSYFHNMAAKRSVLKKKAFEALLLDASGSVTEGATSNIFWIKQNQIFTPPLSSGALAGITRKHLIKLFPEWKMKFSESAIKPMDLHQMDEIFLSSSVVLIMPVREVDGHKIGTGVYPVTQVIRQNFETYLEDLSLK